MENIFFNRRNALRAVSGLAAAFYTTRGAFADALSRTPGVEEGPFYPRKLPLDTDNDLVIVNDSITPAAGEVTELSGRLLDASGAPIRNAMIEIWQVDNNAAYLEEANRSSKSGYDGNFQGFGRFLTGSTGEYLFRTIKPVPYRGRPAPHIHFKVKVKGNDAWTTQLFVKGHAGNERDGIYRRVREKDLVSVDFTPIKGAHTGELAARFDIVMGIDPRR